MNAKDAVARRIQYLCLERDIAVNALANQSGVSPSTIYSMLNKKSQNTLPFDDSAVLVDYGEADHIAASHAEGVTHLLGNGNPASLAENTQGFFFYFHMKFLSTGA